MHALAPAAFPKAHRDTLCNNAAVSATRIMCFKPWICDELLLGLTPPPPQLAAPIADLMAELAIRAELATDR